MPVLGPRRGRRPPALGRRHRRLRPRSTCRAVDPRPPRRPPSRGDRRCGRPSDAGLAGGHGAGRLLGRGHGRWPGPVAVRPPGRGTPIGGSGRGRHRRASPTSTASPAASTWTRSARRCRPRACLLGIDEDTGASWPTGTGAPGPSPAEPATSLHRADGGRPRRRRRHAHLVRAETMAFIRVWRRAGPVTLQSVGAGDEPQGAKGRVVRLRPDVEGRSPRAETPRARAGDLARGRARSMPTSRRRRRRGRHVIANRTATRATRQERSVEGDDRPGGLPAAHQVVAVVDLVERDAVRRPSRRASACRRGRGR